MKTTMKYGARKGSMNIFRQWIAKVVSRELCLFPVPGPDILRTYQSEPLNGEARLTTNPREANVLLIMGNMNRSMAEQAATVYSQMPRPRVLLLAGPEHLDPLPHPDVHVALEKDFLQTALPAVGECLSSHAWMDETEVWQPETLVNKIEETSQQQGHMHDHGGHDHNSHGAHDHGHEDHQHGGHERHEHNHEDHDHSSHHHGEGDDEHKHQHGEQHSHGHGEHHQGKETSHEQESKDKKGHHGEADEHKHDHKAHQHGEHEEHQHDDDDVEHEHGHEGHQHKGHSHGEQHQDHDHSQHEEHGHSHGGHDHGGHQHGDHGHGGHDHGSGFMSMIAMTKDLPRSADGLPMEWSDVQFGPFHPGLPGGLCLSMKLDGDTVAEAKADRELPSRNLLTAVPDDPAALPEYLEAVNPMAPVTYRLLAQKALANFSGEEGNSALTLNEAVLLEKERITSHLNWLAVFAVALGSDWMRDQAIKHYHHFQNDAGNVQQLSGFINRIKKMPYLKLKLSAASHQKDEVEKHKHHQGEHSSDSEDHPRSEHEGHGHHDKEHDHGAHQLGKHDHSHGDHDPGEDHEHSGHDHGHAHGDHEHHRGHVHAGHQHKEHDVNKKHHGDHDHKHEANKHGGHKNHEHRDHQDHEKRYEKDQDDGSIPGQLPDDITGPVARAAGIRKDSRMKEGVYQKSGWTPVTATGNNAWSRLMVRLDEIEQSLRFIEKAGNDSGRESSQKINIPSTGMGNGIAHIESPRGIVTLKFHIHEGKLAHVHLATPSAALAGLVKPVTEQRELADALTAVTSLDISPWEINP